MHHGRKRVVRRLAVIHVVVGMNRLLRADHAAGELDRPVGDHLVRVHVGLCARAGLKHDQRKLVVPAAVDHFLRGPHDQVDFLLGKLAQLAVGQGGALFHYAESADHRTAPTKTFDADGEVE